MKLKLKKEDKEVVVKLLDKITQLYNIDDEMYDLIPGEKNNDQGNYIFFEWSNCQNVIIELMSNTNFDGLYEIFGTPGNIGEKPKRPVGWYQTQFNIEDKYMKGPRKLDDINDRYSGYIPDRITDVIYHKTMGAEYKYECLRKMLKDLKKIQKEFKR